MNCQAPTQMAIDAAQTVRKYEYVPPTNPYKFGGDKFVVDNYTAATIIQAAIDEAVREALEKAAERAVTWYNECVTPQDFDQHLDDDKWYDDVLRAAILGEE